MCKKKTVYITVYLVYKTIWINQFLLTVVLNSICTLTVGMCNSCFVNHWFYICIRSSLFIDNDGQIGECFHPFQSFSIKCDCISVLPFFPCVCWGLVMQRLLPHWLAWPAFDCGYAIEWIGHLENLNHLVASKRINVIR